VNNFGLKTVMKGERTMKLFLGFVALMLFSFGCDSQETAERVDGGAGDAGRADTLVLGSDTLKDDVGGYTPNGVTLNLGVNPCTNYTVHSECFKNGNICGWDPATGGCYVGSRYHSWVCLSPEEVVKIAAGTVFAAGTIKAWYNDPAHTYLGDASGGYICLTNSGPYTFYSTTN
jgi:hypothetical protein